MWLFLVFLLRRRPLCRRLECDGVISAHGTTSHGFKLSCLSLLPSSWTTGARHHAQLIFAAVETGFPACRRIVSRLLTSWPARLGLQSAGMSRRSTSGPAFLLTFKLWSQSESTINGSEDGVETEVGPHFPILFQLLTIWPKVIILYVPAYTRRYKKK